MIESLIFITALALSFASGVVVSLQFEKRMVYKLIPLYFVLGIVLTTFLVYFARLFNLPFLVVPLITAILIVWQRKKIINFPLLDIKQAVLPSAFIFICVLILGWIGFNQGYRNGNLVFFNENAHDGLWHIALQKELITSVPPENPIYSGEILKGYHYFADLFWAYLSSVSHLPAESIYVVFLPFFLTALFAASSLLLFTTYIKDRYLAYIFSSILVLGSGFSFFVRFLFPGGSSNQSSFWLDQPVGYIVNPHLLFSFSVINILFWQLTDGIKKWRIIIGILLSSLVAIKVYAFITFAPVLGLIALFYFLKRRDNNLLISCLIALVLALILLVTSKVSNGFPFFLEPGWFIKTMFESSDHLNATWWELQAQTYAAHSNYLHLTIHWIFGFLVFAFGNFGLKILGLFFLPVLFLKSIDNKNKAVFFLCLMLILLNILIPLLFLQKGVVWSSIQFLHFIQLPLCLVIFLAIQHWKKNIQYILALTILIFGLPTSIQAFANTTNSSNYIFYPSGMISGLKGLNLLTEKKTIIATGDFKSSSLVPAITGKAVYFADPNMLGILQMDFTKRKGFVDLTESKSICPPTYILITPPDATISGELFFQGSKIKIIKCL